MSNKPCGYSPKFKFPFLNPCHWCAMTLDLRNSLPSNYYYLHLNECFSAILNYLAFMMLYFVVSGDPFLYHSYFIAVCIPYQRFLSPLDLITYGRLATNVKKTVIICSINGDDDAVYTSLQWTGLSWNSRFVDTTKVYHLIDPKFDFMFYKIYNEIFCVCPFNLLLTHTHILNR